MDRGAGGLHRALFHAFIGIRHRRVDCDRVPRPFAQAVSRLAVERRARRSRAGVLPALFARGSQRRKNRLPRLGRQTGFTRHDPARLLALAGLDFARCAGRVVPGGVVAQPGISLGSQMAGHCRIPFCAVLGDPVDVGRRSIGPGHSRAAVLVCSHLGRGARGPSRAEFWPRFRCCCSRREQRASSCNSSKRSTRWRASRAP